WYGAVRVETSASGDNVPERESTRDRQRAIGRSVVHDDDFRRRPGLVQRRRKRLAGPAFGVVGRNRHEHRRHWTGPCVVEARSTMTLSIPAMICASTRFRAPLPTA